MSTEQTAISDPPEEPYAPLAGDEWDEDHEDLPPRPRRRLLGAGGNPIQLALLGVLLLACGFIGGVLVEKGQTSSGTSGAGGALASRLAALRGAGATGSGAAASGSGGSAAGGSAAGGSASGGGFAGRFAGAGAAGGATIGEVSYISGSTLYVTNTEGNTVKVTTSPASSITKTVKTDVHGIHPGETVIVRGAKGSSGAVSAESVSVSTGAGASGGLGALFGGGAGGGGGARAAAGGGGSAAAGEPALFGK